MDLGCADRLVGWSRVVQTTEEEVRSVVCELRVAGAGCGQRVVRSGAGAHGDAQGNIWRRVCAGTRGESKLRTTGAVGAVVVVLGASGLRRVEVRSREKSSPVERNEVRERVWAGVCSTARLG